MKIKNFLLIFMIACASISYAQDSKYQLSSHILDVIKLFVNYF